MSLCLRESARGISSKLETNPAVTADLQICTWTKLKGSFFELMSATTELWNVTTSMIPGELYIYYCKRKVASCHRHFQANDSVMAPFIHLASLSFMQCRSRQVLCPSADPSNTWLAVHHWTASDLRSCLTAIKKDVLHQTWRKNLKWTANLWLPSHPLYNNALILK